MTLIRWNKINSVKIGWLDAIPDDWLELETAQDRDHPTLFEGKRPTTCHCDIRREENMLILDYSSRHARLNDFTPGKTVLRFEADGSLLPEVTYLHDDGSEGVGTIIAEAPSASEGSRKLLLHERVERKSDLKDLKIALTLLAKGNVACEACSFDFENFYGEVARNYCEVHHNVKLANGERVTSIDDLSIVCANCHAIIHRSERDGRMMTVGDLVELLSLS